MGYYIEQIENNYKADWEKALNEGIDGAITPMYDTFKSIIEENDFPSKAEERWVGMLEKIRNLSSEIKTDTAAKYDEMITKAQTFQKWYDDLKSLEGDNGLDWAWKNGFEPRHDEIRTWSKYTSLGIVQKVVRYRWTSYSSVSIDGDGYISLSMIRREKVNVHYVDGAVYLESQSVLGTKTVSIRTEEDYNKYYAGRGGEIF